MSLRQCIEGKLSWLLYLHIILPILSPVPFLIPFRIISFITIFPYALSLPQPQNSRLPLLFPTRFPQSPEPRPFYPTSR